MYQSLCYTSENQDFVNQASFNKNFKKRQTAQHFIQCPALGHEKKKIIDKFHTVGQCVKNFSAVAWVAAEGRCRFAPPPSLGG